MQSAYLGPTTRSLGRGWACEYIGLSVKPGSSEESHAMVELELGNEEEARARQGTRA